MSAKMRRKVMLMVFFLMDETGINITKAKSHKSWRLWFGLFVISLAITGMMLDSIMNRKKFYGLVNPVIYIGAGIILSTAVLALFKYRRNVGSLVSNIDGNIYIYSDESHITVKYRNILNEKATVTLLFVVFGCHLLSLGIILFMPTIQLIMYGHTTIFIFPVWTPWELNDTRSETIMVLIQSIMCTVGIWFYYIPLMFVLIITIEFLRQFQRISVAISSLNQRTQKTIMNGRSLLNKQKFQFDEVFAQYVKQCIKHHQLLIENHNLLKPIFSMIYSSELATGLMTYAFFLYIIILNADNIKVIIGFAGVVFIINGNFLARCYIGQIFCDLNNKFQDAVFYDTKWYEQSKENQKLLAILHMQARYSFDLRGFSIVKSNLSVYLTILRLTYSFYNVIKTRFNR